MSALPLQGIRILDLTRFDVKISAVDPILDPGLFQQGSAAQAVADSADSCAGGVVDIGGAAGSDSGPVKHVGQIGREGVAIKSEPHPANFKTILDIIIPTRFEILPLDGDVAHLQVKPRSQIEIPVFAPDVESTVLMAGGK